jgi:anti-sigma factor RsiW
MRAFGGHIGSSVSALVDGQLDHDEAERAWSHILTCPPCRRLVEREGWVKRQLATMGGSEPSARLLGSLHHLEPAADAWAAVDELERRGRGRRRAGLALAGAGSVSAAVLGIATLGGAGLGIGGAPAGTPATNLTRPTSSTPTTAVVAPKAAVHGRVPMPLRDTGREQSVLLLHRR